MRRRRATSNGRLRCIVWVGEQSRLASTARRDCERPAGMAGPGPDKMHSVAPRTAFNPPDIHMEIEVEFWGVTARLAGGSERPLALPDSARVADAIATLSQAAELAQELKRCAFAVNDEMVDTEHRLRPGDRLAVLPPVSGG